MAKPRRHADSSPNDLQLALRHVIAQVVLHNYGVAEQVGLSPRDMQAIHVLQLNGPLTPGQLGAALGLASASVTALIDRLERAGYAYRERDPSDRRKVVVSLDHERLGRDLAPRYAAQAAKLDRVAKKFTSAERATITTFLHELAADDGGV
jgi:DNA-binding MarR family transcriptional regulator